MKNLNRSAPMSFDAVENHAIHDCIIPGEVYAGEKVTAELQTIRDKRVPATKISIWRISPLGVEINADGIGKEVFDNLAVGDHIGLKICVGNQETIFHGLTVQTRHEENGQNLIGIRWCDSSSPTGTKPKNPMKEKRASARWLCGQEFMPSGIAPNPARFNEFVHFRVMDISKGGILLITSLRNRFLIPGMTLNASVSFPMCAQLRVNLELRNSRIVTVEGKKFLAFGSTFVKPDAKLMSTIGQYIFQFGPKATVAQMKKNGISVSNASQGLEFGFVRTEEEYHEVLKLRLLAYKAVGKIRQDATETDVADIYDSRSRIIIARYRNEIIASIRLMFHNPEDRFEVEEHTVLPRNFPSKHECVEISRLCTHPDFRESDLFYNMVRRITITAAQAGKRFAVSFATPGLVELYKKVGATPTGVKFPHRNLNGQEHEVITWDIAKAVTGYKMNPFVWNFIYGDIRGYLSDETALQFDPLMNLRAGMFRLLNPLTPMFIRAVRYANGKKKTK